VMPKVRKVTLVKPQPKLNRRQKREVKQLVSNVQEKKFWQLYSGYASVNASGTIVKWSSIPQGDTVSSRDGSEINFKNLELRFSIFSTAAAVMTGNAFRIIVFQWKPDDAVAVPAVGDIIDTAFTQPCFSPVRFQTHQEFRVMFDRLYRVYNGGPGVAGTKVTLRRAAKRIRYTGATSGTNQIYVLVISDAAVQTPSWSYGAYLRFVDS